MKPSNLPDYVELRVSMVKHETDDAVLVEYEGEDIWIPKSCLEDYPDVGDGGDILVQQWIAVEKGMV